MKFGAAGFGGGLYLAVVAVLLLLLVGAASVIADVVRRRMSASRGEAAPAAASVAWAIPQIALLIAAALGEVIRANAALSIVIGTLFLLAAVSQIAYLVFVVFPSPAPSTGSEVTAEDKG